MKVAPVEVAVGVLIRPDGAFLLAQRPPGKPMAGYWEFPGGKLEAGESVFEALRRELIEELGLEITRATPWAVHGFVYPHATVRLHFWRAWDWIGAPVSREAQAFRWESIDALSDVPWLPGALPLRRWLQLPATYVISNAAELGVDTFLARLDARLAGGDLRLLQLREKTLDAATFAHLFDAVHGRMREHGARLLVNSAHPRQFWTRADGVHCSAALLHRLTARPDADWCAASCHDARDIARAGELGMDFAVLGPVLPTASHPGAPTLGWAGFADTIAATAIPVYALGGLDAGQVNQAIAHGAQGIAALRAAWPAH